jgi:Uncharacterized protein conserved in cyanobacteria
MADLALNLGERFAYGDYSRWPEGERWELIDGQAWAMSPSPLTSHQELSRRLERAIDGFLVDKPCHMFHAPFDVLFPESDEPDDEVATVVQPDILVICDKSKITKAGARGAPDFIAEILSPRTAKKDFGPKFELYQRHGVREYWIVDPDAKAIHAWDVGEDRAYGKERLYEGSGHVASTALEGFEVNAGELFADLD